MTSFPALEPLKIADPDTYALVSRRVAGLELPPGPDDLALLAEAVIWALSVESGLGQAVAEGLLRLLAAPPAAQAPAYIRRIREAAATGATLARILAQHLPRVLLAGTRMEERFAHTLAAMLGKGLYTLSMPLALLEKLLAEGDLTSAEAYLELLEVVFRQPLSYNQSNRLAQHLPQAIGAFPIPRRAAQIGRLAEVAAVDLDLAGAFIEGMPSGLALLPAQNLSVFVRRALDCYRGSPAAGLAFLSLGSAAGQEACAALQVAATLAAQKQELSRYLRARLGRPVVLASLNSPGAPAAGRESFVCSDSHFIYLREEIDHFAYAALNRDLYKTLVRLEAGLFEGGSFDFDLERAADLFPTIAQWLHAHPLESPKAAVCETERFLQTFPCRQAAVDLLAVFELARVSRLMAVRYPGLMRRVLPLVLQEAQRLRALEETAHPLRSFYERLVLQAPVPETAESSVETLLAQVAAHFLETVGPESPVELSACFTCEAYVALAAVFESDRGAYKTLTLPFGHRPHWELVSRAQAACSATVLQIKARLQQAGLPLYRMDLYNQLAQKQGGLSAQDIIRLVLVRRPEAAGDALAKLNGLDWRALLGAAGIELLPEPAAGGRVFYYPEWDHALQDYLKAHVRVQESSVPAGGSASFYSDTLVRRRGLITQMRRAFELLKPEAVTILRQWPEGDDFDYRALLDFAVDRRLGRIPSDRLFIKRLKQERSVAVLLLVDVSRSTANPVAGGHTTVLEVAREALVLFCEALQVVGDSYALAGFSGTGRHSVDYFPLKNFDEPLDDEVKRRIAALTPQRSTRMGAAIRHATAVMQAAAARVRLIILVSDGFPNDLGYKADYAIADTRRAVQEARAQRVHVKAITVNIGGSPGLDEIYGRHHHRVISDVRELPGRLLRLYGVLTKAH